MMTPFGHLAEGNPFEMYVPPTLWTDRPT
ncbi:MAG: DUF6117 family protein [Aestuariivirga sp.]